MKLNEKLRLWHRAWRYVYKTERHEIALVRDLLQPGQLAIDIGAHKAAFTYWMARAVGRRGKVIACEPNPTLATYLRKVASLFPAGQIDVLEAAFSDENTRKRLHFPSEQLGMASLEVQGESKRPPIDVDTMRLDDYLPPIASSQPVSLIKCDVEHHELAVFRGAERLLSEQRPILLFESANLRTGGDVCQQVFDLLGCFGYEGFFFQHDRLVSLTDYDPQQHHTPPTNQNFVFTHAEEIHWESSRRPYKVTRLHAPRKKVA